MIASCGSSKTVAAENEPVEVTETAEAIRIVGTVHLSDTGCKLYIDARENDGTTFLLYPENLDPRFQVEGMYLKFYYAITHTELPENCKAQMSASLSEVTPLRK